MTKNLFKWKVREYLANDTDYMGFQALLWIMDRFVGADLSSFKKNIKTTEQ